MFFMTDDAKIRTICEVCKSCTQERRKDAQRTAINYWLANSCNDNKYFFAYRPIRTGGGNKNRLPLEIADRVVSTHPIAN